MQDIVSTIDKWLERRSATAPRDVVDLLLDIRSMVVVETQPEPTPEDYEAALAEIAA